MGKLPLHAHLAYLFHRLGRASDHVASSPRCAARSLLGENNKETREGRNGKRAYGPPVVQVIRIAAPCLAVCTLLSLKRLLSLGCHPSQNSYPFNVALN